MRLLLDSCITPSAGDVLRAEGHDVVCVGEWPRDPGDQALLDQALREQRIIVRLDKDFGTLAVVQGRRHAGLIRLVGFPAREQGLTVVKALDRYGPDLARGALLTIDPGRVRIRPADASRGASE